LISSLEEVAQANKPVLLIFNKANIKTHRSLWPKRVQELVERTGIQVIGTFAVGQDDERAERGELLDFYQLGEQHNAPHRSVPMDAIHDLRVPELRIQSEWGALRHALDAESGLAAFLTQLEQANLALTRLGALFSADH